MNSMELTNEQRKVLNMTRHYKSMHGELPSLNTIAKVLGYKNKSSAQYQMKTLRHRGMLDLVDMPTEMIQIPLIGNVSCGLPLLADDNIEGWIPVELSKLKHKSAKYFFLRAIGDSMNRADIQPGDFVLIRQQPTAHLNEIIVAMIGDSATLKKLSRTKDGIPMLEPCSTNPVHKPQIMLEEFSIGGIFENVFKPKKEAHMA